jgi:DNA-binding CsgD family transcriptional regulator
MGRAQALVRRHGPGDVRLPGAAAMAQAALVSEVVALVARGDPPAEEVLEHGARGLAGLLGDSCIASLVSDDGQWLHPLGVADPDPQAVEVLESFVGGRMRADRGFARQVLASRRAVRLTDTSPEVVRAGRPELGVFVARFGVRSLVVAPMRSRGRAVGHVAVLRRRAQLPLTDEDEALVQTIADLLAIGVDSAASPTTKLKNEHAADPDGAELSGRESEVLALLAVGHTNREIAEQLILSVRTVEWHRARIQWKLGVSGRAALVEQARARSLID